MEEQRDEYYHYNYYEVNPLQYLDHDKLYELTAKITDANPLTVQRVVEYVMMNLKNWMRDPYARGGYFIPNWGTFSFIPERCEDEIRKIHTYLRNNKDNPDIDPESIKQSLKNRDVIKRRYSLGLHYERTRKNKGEKINAFRKNKKKKE